MFQLPYYELVYAWKYLASHFYLLRQHLLTNQLFCFGKLFNLNRIYLIALITHQLNFYDLNRAAQAWFDN